jgi:hypothetical protein
VTPSLTFPGSLPSTFLRMSSTREFWISWATRSVEAFSSMKRGASGSWLRSAQPTYVRHQAHVTNLGI